VDPRFERNECRFERTEGTPGTEGRAEAVKLSPAESSLNVMIDKLEQRLGCSIFNVFLVSEHRICRISG
jgi:hypothetical protein